MGVGLAASLSGQPLLAPAIAKEADGHLGHLWQVGGQPIRCLLGNYRNSFETDLTVYLDDPQIMTEKAQSVVDRRFKTVKVKLGESAAADITHSVPFVKRSEMT